MPSINLCNADRIAAAGAVAVVLLLTTPANAQNLDSSYSRWTTFGGGFGPTLYTSLANFGVNNTKRVSYKGREFTRQIGINSFFWLGGRHLFAAHVGVGKAGLVRPVLMSFSIGPALAFAYPYRPETRLKSKLAVGLLANVQLFEVVYSGFGVSLFGALTTLEPVLGLRLSINANILE